MGELKVVRVFAGCLLALFAASARADDLGIIPRIVDADTIYLGAEKIRLQGFDAPETDQACLDAEGRSFHCGLEARIALEKRFGSHPWTCRSSEKDRYGRTLATCTADGEDVGRWLVREGWALAFRRYSTVYVNDEDFAREGRRGLWKGAFMAPWDWRRRSSSTMVLGAASVPVGSSRILTGPTVEVPHADCTIKGNLRSKQTCIYHVPGGQYYRRLDMTDRETRRWFCSEAEAQAAGCRRSKL
jgi:endonuclease YncB( thermonuclease family)